MTDNSSKKASGGYSKAYFFLNSLFNISFSLILIACAIPIMVVIAVLLKIINGGPIFYKGVRLGLNKTSFIMYKFRTLIPDAQKKIGAQILSDQIASEINLLTPFGRFLRETRLDELPQLYNILKGDMDFLGPRPERPEIYEKFCKQIKGYDKRFLVKPGLIGYSQLFTPHNSPKRIRTLIDNNFLKKKQKFLWDIAFIFLTIFVVIGRIILFGSRFIRGKLISKIIGRYDEKRGLERIKVDNTTIYLKSRDNDHGVFTNEAKLVDLNDDAILVYSKGQLDKRGDLLLIMEIVFHMLHGKKNRKKVAICYGEVYKSIKIQKDHFSYAHVIKYTPVSPLNSYMVHQYFLQRSII